MMEKITTKEAIGLILTIIINNVVLVCSKIVVETTSSASLINALYVSIIAIFLTWLICILYKKFAGQDILDISNFLGGKVLKFIVGTVFLVYFLFMVSILLRRITDCLQIIYYPLTNFVYIILLFIIGVAIVCNFKDIAISRANYIILPVVLASIILVFIGNIKNFNYDSIYPLLGHNIDSTFFAGMSNLFSFSGIAYLYFISPSLTKPEKFNKIAVISIFLSGIFFVFSIASILFMFNNTLSSSELFPLYMAVRYIEFGSFFQRLDSTFLLIWVISFVSFFSIITSLCASILKKLTKLSDDKPIVLPILFCILGISMLIKNSALLEFSENNIFKISFFVVTIGLGFVILLLANLKYKLKGYKNE